MLSVCIPIYNYDISSLVYSINEQCSKFEINYEILLIDDASELCFKELNRTSVAGENISYLELDENIGRSAIRNLLCEKSKFENLLYLDCDVLPAQLNFIENYIEQVEKAEVVCGGISYYLQEPESEFLLHWKYGIEIEVQSLSDRLKEPYNSFVTGCFLIKKNLLAAIRFDDKILSYGHEDTLLGIELKRREVSIIHINNPVIHLGLSESSVFIEKSLTAVKSLSEILDRIDNKELFIFHIKLLSFWKRISKLRLNFMLALFYYLFGRVIKSNLKGRKPNLLAFSFLKLFYLGKIRHNKNN